MKRCFALASVLVVAASATGCAMCCSPYDDAYNAYGGKWQRADMYNGRVGSAFHPAQTGGGQVVYQGGMAQSGGEVIYQGSPQESYEYYQDSVPTPPPGGRTSPFQEEARRQPGAYR